MEFEINNDGLRVTQDGNLGWTTTFDPSDLSDLVKYATKAKMVHMCKNKIIESDQTLISVRDIMRQVNGSKKCHVVKAAELLGAKVVHKTEQGIKRNFVEVKDV